MLHQRHPGSPGSGLFSARRGLTALECKVTRFITSFSRKTAALVLIEVHLNWYNVAASCRAAFEGTNPGGFNWYSRRLQFTAAYRLRTNLVKGKSTTSVLTQKRLGGRSPASGKKRHPDRRTAGKNGRRSLHLHRLESSTSF